TILLASSLATATYGQQPTPLEEKLDESVTGQPATGETSDVGAQTPVDVGGAISSYGGLDLRYLYRDNALSVSEPLGNAVKSGIIQHTFYAGAILPSRSLADGVITPFIGASRTDVYHDNKDLESFDNAANSAYLLFQYQLANGLTVRAGVEYAGSLNTVANTEDYVDYHTNVSLLKFFPLDNGHSLLATIKTGQHKTQVDAVTNTTATADRLDNWESSVTLQYSFSPLEKVIARPFASVSVKKYTEGQNDDREDVTTTFGISGSYDLKPWLQIVGSVVSVNRDSDGLREAGKFYNPNMANEFENWDAGIGINISHSF
ncbi:MAG: hypothetical protein AAEJ57_06305, partial [Opitutales bacterium]